MKKRKSIKIPVCPVEAYKMYIFPHQIFLSTHHVSHRHFAMKHISVDYKFFLVYLDFKSFGISVATARFLNWWMQPDIKFSLFYFCLSFSHFQLETVSALASLNHLSLHVSGDICVQKELLFVATVVEVTLKIANDAVRVTQLVTCSIIVLLETFVLPQKSFKQLWFVFVSFLIFSNKP